MTLLVAAGKVGPLLRLGQTSGLVLGVLRFDIREEEMHERQINGTNKKSYLLRSESKLFSLELRVEKECSKSTTYMVISQEPDKKQKTIIMTL